MNITTFKAHLRALGLAQTDFAHLCWNPKSEGRGVSARIVRNWCASQVPLPGYAIDALNEARRVAEEVVQAGIWEASRAEANGYGPMTLLAYRSSHEMWAVYPDRRPYPAGFWNVAAARVQNGCLPGLVLIESGDAEAEAEGDAKAEAAGETVREEAP